MDEQGHQANQNQRLYSLVPTPFSSGMPSLRGSIFNTCNFELPGLHAPFCTLALQSVGQVILPGLSGFLGSPAALSVSYFSDTLWQWSVSESQGNSALWEALSEGGGLHHRLEHILL